MAKFTNAYAVRGNEVVIEKGPKLLLRAFDQFFELA